MIIERNDKEIIIKIPSTVDTGDLQNFIDYLKYKELTSDIDVPQEVVDEMSAELNRNWWKKTKTGLLNESDCRYKSCIQ